MVARSIPASTRRVAKVCLSSRLNIDTNLLWLYDFGLMILIIGHSLVCQNGIILNGAIAKALFTLGKRFLAK